VLRYAITSRAVFPGDDHRRRAALVEQAARWASDGVDFIQLREKDLSAAELAALARKLLEKVNLVSGPTRLLINARADIAIAAGVHGVHFTSAPGELTPAHIRRLYAAAGLPSPVVTISCHTLAEVTGACEDQADAILFAPVFEKPLPGQSAIAGQGLEALHTACLAASPIPVYALGGVTTENAPACLQAGAAGIAGIRLFHNP
jgi:thiamine-phosphate pyrophosphorylase